MGFQRKPLIWGVNCGKIYENLRKFTNFFDDFWAFWPVFWSIFVFAKTAARQGGEIFLLFWVVFYRAWMLQILEDSGELDTTKSIRDNKDARCRSCFSLRLEKVGSFASDKGFDFVVHFILSLLIYGHISRNKPYTGAHLLFGSEPFANPIILSQDLIDF